MALKPQPRFELSHAELLDRLHYDQESGIFTWKKRTNSVHVGDRAGSLNYGYRSIVLNKRWYRAHVLAWFYVHGVWPGQRIDHRDLNKDNNAISNLRLCTHSENLANTARLAANKSGFKGVHFHKVTQKWAAQIGSRETREHLGLFDTPEEAHAAYVARAKERYGEFARVA